MLTRATIDFLDNPHDGHVNLTRQKIIDALRYEFKAEVSIFDKTAELALLLKKLLKERGEL